MHHTQNVLDKNQKTEFLQKAGTLDLKILKQITLSSEYKLINCKEHECKCRHPK